MKNAELFSAYKGENGLKEVIIVTRSALDRYLSILLLCKEYKLWASQDENGTCKIILSSQDGCNYKVLLQESLI